MTPHYRHTQVGWVMLGGAVAAAAFALPLLPLGHVPVPASVALLLVVVVLLLFSTLTVEVDGEQVRIGFSGGVVRRRIALNDILRLQRVRNAWWYGFGIRLLPGGGWLWNVSGLDAIELVLRDGRRFRIGTDEPDALARAIERVTGSLPARGESPSVAGRRSSLGTGLALSLAALGAAGALFAAIAVPMQMRPPRVTVTPQRIAIETLFYGESYRMDEVTGVSLEGRLPTILQRANGFSGSGELRGWFLLEGLGKGKLFVTLGNAPYVLIRTRQSFAVVNFGDPRRTQALYDEIVAARGAR